MKPNDIFDMILSVIFLSIYYVVLLSIYIPSTNSSNFYKNQKDFYNRIVLLHFLIYYILYLISSILIYKFNYNYKNISLQIYMINIQILLPFLVSIRQIFQLLMLTWHNLLITKPHPK